MFIIFLSDFWYHRNHPSHVCKVEEHTLKYSHLVAYDYPDLYSTDSKDVPIRFGTFGKVGLKEIVELTGKTHFNLKIGKSNDVHKFVLNDEGTKAYFEGETYCSFEASEIYDDLSLKSLTHFKRLLV